MSIAGNCRYAASNSTNQFQISSCRVSCIKSIISAIDKPLNTHVNLLSEYSVYDQKKTFCCAQFEKSFFWFIWIVFVDDYRFSRTNPAIDKHVTRRAGVCQIFSSELKNAPPPKKKREENIQGKKRRKIN